MKIKIYEMLRYDVDDEKVLHEIELDDVYSFYEHDFEDMNVELRDKNGKKIKEVCKVHLIYLLFKLALGREIPMDYKDFYKGCE